MVKPETDSDLARLTYLCTGIRIADNPYCEHHVSPFKAFADAYFCRSPIAVWHASRGFGGKSLQLATLSMIEAIFQAASVSLLGGSGEQSARVHSYITGQDTNLPNTFWACPTMPYDIKMLVDDKPTKRETRLANGGRINVLMASQASVRGPHPNKLRLDECDEMDLKIFEASLGQPMSSRGIQSQTVCSSTHHNPNGTMTEILDRAKKRGWPIYEWCYRENLTTQGGWLDPRDVDARRLSYTESLWKAEIELQEPTPEDRGINTEAVEAMFRREMGEYVGNPDEYIECEPPVEGGKYATGADWAQKRDWSVFWTWRIDVEPVRLVAFQRTGRRSWSEMIQAYDVQCERFKGASGYDETGVGNVVKDFMKTKSRGFILTDKVKLILINNYIKAIEDGKVVAPMIQYAYGEHKFCSRDELIGAGHLPDTVCSAAIGWQMRGGGGWARGAA